MSRAAALVVLVGAGTGLALAAYWYLRSGGEATGDSWFGPDAASGTATTDQWQDAAAGLDYAPYVGDLPVDPAIGTDAPAEYEVARQADETLVPSAGGLTDALTGGFYQAKSMLFGMTMRTSLGGIERIKMHEKFMASVYPDQAGKPTIGYGHLIRPGESFPGPITEARAREILAADLGVAESAVNGGVAQRITQNQFDALVSFVFNVGVEAFRTSTLRKKLNAGDVLGAADEFKRWNKVQQGGVLIASVGLSTRRAAEAQLFTQGVMV